MQELDFSFYRWNLVLVPLTGLGMLAAHIALCLRLDNGGGGGGGGGGSKAFPWMHALAPLIVLGALVFAQGLLWARGNRTRVLWRWPQEAFLKGDRPLDLVVEWSCCRAETEAWLQQQPRAEQKAAAASRGLREDGRMDRAV